MHLSFMLMVIYFCDLVLQPSVRVERYCVRVRPAESKGMYCSVHHHTEPAFELRRLQSPPTSVLGTYQRAKPLATNTALLSQLQRYWSPSDMPGSWSATLVGGGGMVRALGAPESRVRFARAWVASPAASAPRTTFTVLVHVSMGGESLRTILKTRRGAMRPASLR